MQEYRYDLFICHAWEDKEGFVRPLADILRSLGLKVWYDEFILRVGDSLLRSIDQGLAQSSHGIVVLSKAFFTKEIPQHEFRGLLTRQLHEGRKVILPIWHGVNMVDVHKFSPTLADSLALRTAEMAAPDIGVAVLREVRPDIYEQYERDDLLRLYKDKPLHELHDELERLRGNLAEFQCPYCGALMEEHSGYSSDDFDLDKKVFACGCRIDNGWVELPCPNVTDVPEFDEFSIEYQQGGVGWSARATPKTSRAKRFINLYFDGYLYPYKSRGNQSKEEAYEILYETYLRQFKHAEWQKYCRIHGVRD